MQRRFIFLHDDRRGPSGDGFGGKRHAVCARTLECEKAGPRTDVAAVESDIGNISIVAGWYGEDPVK